MSVREQLKSGVWRTRELRELLENEEQIKRIVRCSEKFQRLQWAAEKMLVSNKKLAKDNLSQKPKLRDAKLLLALKYKELEKLRSLVQAKQERLEKYSIRQVKACLVQKISHTEQQLELLFQRFSEGKTTLADFLDSFLSSQKLQHTRLVLVKKLQEQIRLQEVPVFPARVPLGFAGQIHLQVGGLTSAVLLPACCLPPVLLPLCPHASAALQSSQRSQHSQSHPEDPELPPSGRGLGRSARPARLQPLEARQKRRQQP
ncbi:vacuolar protein sorting-associated protein 37D-like isoform 2-T2 [Menidia menidia]